VFVAWGLVILCCVQFAAAQSTSGGQVLADGTRVPLRLMQTLTSATATSGEPVSFEVAEDVSVGGQVIVKQGTPVRAVVVEAVPKRRMGRAGKLTYAVTETKSVDRQTIRLRASQQKKSGDSNVTGVAVTTTAVAVFVPVAAPFFLLRKGNDITVPQGTRVDAFVDGEHTLQAAAVVAAPATVAAGVLTNDDVVGLKRAGFSDQVILAKIRTSKAAFKVAPADLVELKTAGVSDEVITAMLEAAPVATPMPTPLSPPAPTHPAEQPAAPKNPVVGRYSTNLVNTTATLAEERDQLALTLEGGEFSGLRVLLRREGDAFIGTASVPPCGAEGTWNLRAVDRRLHGSFDRPSCGSGRASRVGVVLEPVQ
jgi:hypothetical protein